MKKAVIEHTLKTSLFSAAAASLFLLGGLGEAWAHAHPMNQTPAPDATVSAPAEVTLIYGEAIEPALSHLTVVDARGERVSQAKSTVTDHSHKTLRLPLPTLTAGQYKVEWVVVGSDGHRTHGNYTFTVK